MQEGEQADQRVVRPEPLTAADLIPDRVLQPEDQDAFEYAAIAARVADLVSVAPAPMNVALFGPWGSGKSSFAELLRRALAGRKEKVRLVRYDAWKYGGASLQRNLISHVARELGLDEESPANRQFFRGLYEKRRIAEIDPTRLRDNWQTIAAWFVGAVIIFSALFFAALAVIAAVSSEHFSTLVSKHYVGFFTSTAVVAVVVTMAKLLLDGLRVDIEQSAPADEEFTATFGRLVKAGLKNHTRIVFFIDELDRCSRQEVVATLADIKNFLDQPSCVFIVAADREVLERALTTLPQSTPVDEDAPYYSSASEFLDKVFQHEAALPPLRVRRLTRFARDLVLAQSTSGGLWSELRGVPDKKLLDKVIYALIPSHVRSPRRIKVLLNRFATNARIVQARGINWLDRAEEIAKLTVLQTEFPLLAADLHVEPRLPSLLLAPPSNPAPRLKRLLARHRIPTTAEAIAVEEPTATAAAAVSEATSATAPAGVPAAVSETDPLLVEDEEETRLLASVQRLQLRRYLQRAAAAAIPDPARDLLYLEAAGAAVGLEDSELGDVIESAAPDAPGDVLAVLESRTVD
ncbi:MAG: KAP family P-loop NTPase fold protein, partial [Vicinamibacterales bacterium]